MTQTLLDQVMEAWSEIDEVFNNEDLTWEIKYDLIFRLKKGKMDDLVSVSYYDPDTSYEEDVRAYYDALRLKIFKPQEDQ